MANILKFISRDQRIGRFCWQLFSHVSLRTQSIEHIPHHNLDGHKALLNGFARRQHELYLDLKKREVTIPEIGKHLHAYILSVATRTLVRRQCGYCRNYLNPECPVGPDYDLELCDQYAFDHTARELELERLIFLVTKLNRCYGLDAAAVVADIETAYVAAQ